MKMIVGLGNPGPSYLLTRHNIGFLLIDYLQMNINNVDKPQYENKFDAQITSINFANQKILLLKPQTFMNLSGKSVQKSMTFYKIKPEDIIVCHDDIDLQLGKVKAKIGGGHGGHNGLRSIDSLIGNNYYRVRIGVGKDPINITNYVLSNFSKPELEILIDQNFSKILDNFSLLIDGDVNNFAARVNS